MSKGRRGRNISTVGGPIADDLKGKGGGSGNKVDSSVTCLGMKMLPTSEGLLNAWPERGRRDGRLDRVA
jgi:hypothetical protein